MATQTFNDLYPDQDRWTLATALSWIAFRSKGEVDSVVPNGNIGLGDDENEYPPIKGVLAAASLLWPYLSNGRVLATGTYQGESKVIPRESWRHYSACLSFNDEDGNLSVDANYRTQDAEKHLSNIEVDRAEILLLWPRDRSLTHCFPGTAVDEIGERKWLYLGQVVDWIFLRGEPCVFETDALATRGHDSAEREMFSKLVDDDEPVKGINADTNNEEALSAGNLRPLTQERDLPHPMDPEFMSVDPRLRREDGGVLIFKSRYDPEFSAIKYTRYEACFVSGDFVRRHWPARETVNGRIEENNDKKLKSQPANSSEVRLNPAQQMIRRAIEELWPDGKLPPQPKDRYPRIHEQIKASGGTLEGNRTLERYFKVFPP